MRIYLGEKMIDRSFALGRVLVLLEKLSESEIFDEKYWSRPKDACDWFETQTKEKQDDVIHELAYGIQAMDFALSEIISIARGTDDISEREIGVNK
jgi:hypothetical protein